MEYYPNETAHNPFLSYLQTERLISLFVEASGAIGKNEDVKSGLGSNWPGTLCKMCSPVICTDVDRPPLPRTRRHPWSIPLPHPALPAPPPASCPQAAWAYFPILPLWRSQTSAVLQLPLWLSTLPSSQGCYCPRLGCPLPPAADQHHPHLWLRPGCLQACCGAAIA